MRRAISIGVAAILALLVGATVVTSVRERSTRKKVAVRGLVDAEDKAFFDDPAVQHALADRGYVVETDAVDGPELPGAVGRAPYDFAFVAQPWAQAAATDGNVGDTISPFSTRVAIATSIGVAHTLQQQGVASDHGGWWTIDLARYRDLLARGAAPITRSANVTTSTTAQLYAAGAAYATNGARTLAGPADVDAVVNGVAPLFVRQGYVAETSDQLAAEHASGGDRSAPMVVVDESEFVTRGGLGPDSVLMYPDPAVDAQLTVVPLTAVGRQVGRVLAHDATMQRLAAAHGYRTPSQPKRFDAAVRRAHVAVEPQDAPGAPLPSAETLTSLVDRIDAARYSALGPRANP